MKYKVLASNIKKFRKDKGLTQKELGQKICKSEVSIRKYESGNVNIPSSALLSLCNVFNVNRKQLLGDDYNEYLKNNNSYEPLSSHSTSYINKDGTITEVIPKNNGDISESEAILSAFNVLRYEGNKQNFVLGETKAMIDEIKKTAKNLITIAKMERGTKISTEGTSAPTVTHDDNPTNE